MIQSAFKKKNSFRLLKAGQTTEGLVILKRNIHWFLWKLEQVAQNSKQFFKYVEGNNSLSWS